MCSGKMPFSSEGPTSTNPRNPPPTSQSAARQVIELPELRILILDELDRGSLFNVLTLSKTVYPSVIETLYREISYPVANSLAEDDVSALPVLRVWRRASGDASSYHVHSVAVCTYAHSVFAGRSMSFIATPYAPSAPTVNVVIRGTSSSANRRSRRFNRSSRA